MNELMITEKILTFRHVQYIIIHAVDKGGIEKFKKELNFRWPNVSFLDKTDVPHTCIIRCVLLLSFVTAGVSVVTAKYQAE